jgi:histidinol-phosphate/aromatic aminotransferase/cobyric acid decarboxylase-like protein
MVRLCGDYAGLGDDYVRFAVRTAGENRRLAAALMQFAREVSG